MQIQGLYSYIPKYIATNGLFFISPAIHTRRNRVDSFYFDVTTLADMLLLWRLHCSWHIQVPEKRKPEGLLFFPTINFLYLDTFFSVSITTTSCTTLLPPHHGRTGHLVPFIVPLGALYRATWCPLLCQTCNHSSHN